MWQHSNRAHHTGWARHPDPDHFARVDGASLVTAPDDADEHGGGGDNVDEYDDAEDGGGDDDDAAGDDYDDEVCHNAHETLIVTMTKTMMRIRIWNRLLLFSGVGRTTTHSIPERGPGRRHGPPADAREKEAASRG